MGQRGALRPREGTWLQVRTGASDFPVLGLQQPSQERLVLVTVGHDKRLELSRVLLNFVMCSCCCDNSLPTLGSAGKDLVVVPKTRLCVSRYKAGSLG